VKTEETIRTKFEALVKQRDACEKPSAARDMLNERIRGLAWVLEHPQVTELLLSDGAKSLYECVC
jgi:hypothetical protein